VKAGWTFARAVAFDTKAVLLKAFESQTWGMFRGMMIRNGLTMTTTQADSLKASIEQFSYNYVRSRPRTETYSSGEGDHPTSFADLIWNTRWSTKLSGVAGQMVTISGQSHENAWMGYTFAHLQELMQGMSTQNLIQSFDYSKVLVDAAARTTPFYDYSTSENPGFNAGPLRELIELGFEIARVGATNPAGNPMLSSTWLEAVMDGDVKIAGRGLSQFVAPLRKPNISGFHYGDDVRRAIDFAQRLVQVAGAVDDPVLDAEVLRSDFLSELVNFGSIYVAVQEQGIGYGGNDNIIQPRSKLFQDLDFFMDIIWNERNSQLLSISSDSLEYYFSLFSDGKNTNKNRIEVLKSQTVILTLAKNYPFIWKVVKEDLLLAPLFIESGEVKVEKSLLFNNSMELIAQSNPNVYTKRPPWVKKSEEYQEEQRQYVIQTVINNAATVALMSNQYNVTPDAIVGAAFWEAIENPYPVWRSQLAPQWGGIPSGTKFGILGKIHVSDQDVAALVERENRVPFKSSDWVKRAKTLANPVNAIQYIAAIMSRSADIYEATANIYGNDDEYQNRIRRPIYNIRDQAGVLAALFQGGGDLDRARAFENRRTISFRNYGDYNKSPDAVPQLPDNEKMGSWVSAYRWWIRYTVLNQYMGIAPKGFLPNGVQGPAQPINVPIPKEWNPSNDIA
jgi:hypothetical protein